MHKQPALNSAADLCSVFMWRVFSTAQLRLSVFIATSLIRYRIVHVVVIANTIMKINELLSEYAAILKWDGESVMDLYSHIVRLTKSAPAMFAMPLPYIMKMFVHRVGMRFDLSRLDGDVLTVDKHGRALVRTFKGLAVVKLATI